MTLAALTMPAQTVRDGLLQLDPPALIGSHCGSCGTSTFPARNFCPACRNEDGLVRRPLSTAGRVFSFTTIHQAPPGREVPYLLAYVDLADEVRVLSRIEGEAEQIAIGSPVELILIPLERDGDIFAHYAFAPAGQPESAR
jgi:uncharacterized OB-fold protein